MKSEKSVSEKTGQSPLGKQARFSAARQTYRDCPYYPCHPSPENQKDLNCFLCYCPFYPCGGKIGDGKWIAGKDNGKIWDCSPCVFIHRDDVTARVIELFLLKKKPNRIRKAIRKEFAKRPARGYHG